MLKRIKLIKYFYVGINVDGKETVILAHPVCFEVNGKVKELL